MQSDFAGKAVKRRKNGFECSNRSLRRTLSALFNKYSDALVTTLLTKDRVPGHSAAAALYLRKDILFKTDMQLICKGLSAKACKNEMGDTALLCGIPILI